MTYMQPSMCSRAARVWRGTRLLLGLIVTACAPASLVDVQPPSGVVDPAVVATPSGALGLYPYAISNFSLVYAGSVNACAGTYTFYTGVITDELMWASRPEFDTRGWNGSLGNNNNCASGLWPVYNQPRVEARQARQALAVYVPGSIALQGRLMGTEAYAIVMLAELFCSGIPLSTVTFTGVTNPTAGFTTEELLTRANALFDTAIIGSADSSRFVYMARVGKGRALLGLGKLADAAQAVHDVPTDFTYLLTFTTSSANFFGNNPRTGFTQDREGTNGLVWSTDPRTAIVTTPTLSSGMPYSAKYSRTAAGVLDPTQTIANNPVWLASGVEARLIEAEADLAAGGTNWLALLNTLRATCIGTASCAPVPGLTAASLPPLTDPGNANTRLDLLMKERAMWLFLTGHREGDMRRLVRFYHRDTEAVWPTGTYVYPGFPPLIAASAQNGQAYGNSVVFSPEGTSSEGIANPLYKGCFNMDP